jgi:hypothetical protein
MSAARTAAVSLMALILLSSPTSRPRQSDAPSRGDHGAAMLRADSSIALIPLASLPRPSSIAPFAPWRSRLKSVLEETSQRVVDQFDLGPVVLPIELSRSPSVEMIDHHLPMAPPLRC